MTPEEFTARCKELRANILQSRKIVREQILDAAAGDDKENARALLAEYGTGGEVEKEKLSADFYDIFMKEAQSAEDVFAFDDKMLHRDTGSTLHSLVAAFGIESFASILPALDDYAPGSALKARKVALGFDSIPLMDDRLIQKLVRICDSTDLAIALQNADAATQEKIVRALSKRAAALLKEDSEFIGPVRLKDVEEKQDKIMAVLIDLQNGGEA